MIFIQISEFLKALIFGLEEYFTKKKWSNSLEWNSITLPTQFYWFVDNNHYIGTSKNKKLHTCTWYR